jgi:uncharacterized protein with PIN domain
MNLSWIRIKLYEWGVRNRVRGIGYPTMSTTEKARVGRGGGFSEPQLPQDLEEIDQAVRRLDQEHKAIIAECYTHYGTHLEHMARLRLPETTYYRKKKVAEQRVYSLLQAGSGNVASVLR